MLVGYARVSTLGQKLDVQLEKLKMCEKIFQEKKSGLDGKRVALKECMDFMREGDTLVITRLDRLARSTLHLCKISEHLQSKKINLMVIDQNIDTNNATGRLLFNMLAAISQFETEIRAERQREGIDKARKKGIHLGRSRELDDKEVLVLQNKRKSGILIKELMKEYDLSKTSIYRYLRMEIKEKINDTPLFDGVE